MKKTVKNTKNNLIEFLDALDEIEKSKGIDKEEIIQALELALVSAYKKENKTNQNVRSIIDRVTGEIEIYAQKTVVEVVEDEHTEMSLKDARAIHLFYKEGDIVEIAVELQNFGRVAAQNVKQLVLQKIKEAERNKIFDTFVSKKDELLTGVIQRIERNDVYINFEKAEGLMNQSNQIPGEQYFPGMRIKVYVSDVAMSN